MKKKNDLVEFPGITDEYDDGDIPKVDLPGTGKNRADFDDDRPRKDGPGGD